MRIVVDTSTIIDLLDDDVTETIKKNTRQHITSVLAMDAVLMIPAVVIAELHFEGTIGSKRLERFGVLAAGLRIAPFNQAAADLAGRMRADALALRKSEKKEARGAVSYDALIAGTAVAHRATHIYTANPRDYARLLAVVGARVEVVDTHTAPIGVTSSFWPEDDEKHLRAMAEAKRAKAKRKKKT